MNNKTDKKAIFTSILIAIVVFILSLLIMSLIGLAPKSVSIIDVDKTLVKNTEEIIDFNADSYTRPDQIIIDKVGINSIIEKPNSFDVSILDQFLQKGAVHYPGSGSVERGNMFIFGHSTNWQVVQNQAYKTFNGIEKLIEGDEIEILANNETYIYKVTSVNLLDENDALVEFDSSKRTLTISTCNTLGKKQERWVVEAVFYKKG